MLQPFALFVSLLLLQTATALRGNVLHTAHARLEAKRAVAFAPATPLKISQNSISLKRSNNLSKSSKALRSLVVSGNAPITSTQYGVAYTIEIDFGGQLMSVILDTGSSDLWVPSADITCTDGLEDPVPIEACAFGPLYENSTFTGGQIPNQNFHITYGDGEFLSGIMGYEMVCVAGISIDHLEVALATTAYWNGDNVTSGLIGFAYPSLTAAYAGNDTAFDSDVTKRTYNNWFFTAIAQNIVSPMFSIAIERGESGNSQLAIGGLPDVSFQPFFASTPLQIVELSPHSIEKTNLSYYTIIPDGFVVQGSKNTTSRRRHSWNSLAKGSANGNITTTFPVIVDSGTTLTYLPDTIVNEFAAAFVPPAKYLEDTGFVEVACDAVPPYFAVTIGGADFVIDGADLLLTGELGMDPSTGLCITGIQSGQPPLYILGDTFMKNVVAVFDVGASEMRFAVHTY